MLRCGGVKGATTRTQGLGSENEHHAPAVALSAGLTTVQFDVQVKKLQDRMEKLRLENKRYRETNRTAEFEAAVAALQQQVRKSSIFTCAVITSGLSMSLTS